MTSSWTCRNRNVPIRNQKFLHYSSGDRMAVGGAGFGSAPRRCPADCRNFQRQRERHLTQPCVPFQRRDNVLITPALLRTGWRSASCGTALATPPERLHPPRLLRHFTLAGGGAGFLRVPRSAKPQQLSLVKLGAPVRRIAVNPPRQGSGSLVAWKLRRYVYLHHAALSQRPAGTPQQLSQPRQLHWIQRESLCALERP